MPCFCLFVTTAGIRKVIHEFMPEENEVDVFLVHLLNDEIFVGLIEWLCVYTPSKDMCVCSICYLHISE